MLRFAVPALFVFIWSTGFIVAKAASPHADLQLFLVVRLFLTALLMALAAAAAGATWPRGRSLGTHLIAGALMLGFYLCASYWAISRGMAAGVMALLGALQPLFTALFLVAATSTTLGPRTWCGLLVGFGGVAFVLAPKLAVTGAGSLTVLTVTAALLSVVAVTAGTLVQKSLATADIRAAASLQHAGGAVVAVVAALLVGTARWDSAPVLWASLAWSVLVPSIVGTSLLIWMMRKGEATKVTALILLVPPLAAVQAFAFFGETLSPIQFVGFALALGGVLLTRSERMAPQRARAA